jgi:hypothetical protein
MPISDDALQKESNRFIAVKGDARFGQAVAALKALDGQLWWYLVVQLNDGSWRAARMSEIAASLADDKDAAETCLGDAAALKTVPAVEQDSLDTKTATRLARQSAAGVVVVTDNDSPVGILVEIVRRGAAGSPGGLPLSSTSLDQLGGKYVKLKDYGSILLGSSKK